ncbi:MAG: hypothetical protein QGG64_19405 [Candidatus Latescibacteria bacterium]|nr:hypothetical protein [Candidatus Latescibacterota bacterium]
MSHDLSLACYFHAKRDASIPLAQYEELEQILNLLGALEHVPTQLPKPQFSFQTSAPTLIIVEDEKNLPTLSNLS